MSRRLSEYPVHLGRGAGAVGEPRFTGVEWYAGYVARHDDDGTEGRLVSQHTFSAPWETWEMHPEGAEVVICTDGEITLIQEIEGTGRRIVLHAGEYAINERGTWHTADVQTEATAIFITAGFGTQIRPR